MQRFERNAAGALEDAAAQLRTGVGPARRGRGGLPELRERERDFLKERFARQDRVFREDPTLNLDRRQTHGEHGVGFHAPTSCWWKTTHPGKCGVGVELLYEDLPPFAIAGVSTRELLPSEYLERLILHNGEFGDDIRLEGYVDSDVPSLVISQPDISGTPATARQMGSQMQALGYAPLPGFQAGRAKSISFYHPRERIAFFDAHPGNFFHHETMTLPVDGIVLRIHEDAEHRWLLDRIR